MVVTLTTEDLSSLGNVWDSNCKISIPPFPLLTGNTRLPSELLKAVLWIICGVGIQIQEFQNEFSSNKFAWSFVKSASPAGPVQFILKDKCLFILEKINGVLCIGIFKMRWGSQHNYRAIKSSNFTAFSWKFEYPFL